MNADTTQRLYDFLKAQTLLTLATVDAQGQPWTSNVFYDVSESLKLYFVSSLETEHSKHVLQNSSVAFNVVWFDPSNHLNRKSVQGKGVCRVAKSEGEIARGVQGHNERFPEFAERITVEWIQSDENLGKVWLIEPIRMKFWNDELFGVNGCEVWNAS